jgi:hypothetical protein
MNAERATEIINQARARATVGPWSDQLRRIITREEFREVLAVWRQMPGTTCIVDALHKIAKGH